MLDKSEPTRAGRRLTYAESAATIRATANRGTEVRETGGTIAVVLAAPDPSMAGAEEKLRRELDRYTVRVEVESS